MRPTMGLASETGKDIRQLAEACGNHLLKQVDEEECREDDQNAIQGFWASRQNAEFNLWRKRIGVDECGIRSIDFRLKDAPEIHALLETLLRLLESDLQELQLCGSAESRQRSQIKVEGSLDTLSESDSGSSLSFISLSSLDACDAIAKQRNASGMGRNQKTTLQSNIESTINRLHDHAVQIQRAGTSHRRRRVDQYRKENKYAFDGYTKMASFWAKSEFPLATDFIITRIAESIARRRTRFDYMDKHFQRQQAPDTAAMPSRGLYIGNMRPARAKDCVARQLAEEDRGNTADLNPGGTAIPTALPSVTENTKLEWPSETQLQSRAERPESVASIITRHPGWPPLPRLKDSHYQCPYCRAFLRPSEANERFWPQHVMEDFEPYFCTIDQCETPFDCGNTFLGLLAHLQTHLPELYRISTSPGHFKEVPNEEFEQYLQDLVSLSEDEREAMRIVCRHKDPYLFRTCPFCCGYPKDIQVRFPDEDSIEAQTELRKHIRRHMHIISLTYQPHRPDAEDQWKKVESHEFSRKSAMENSTKDLVDFTEPCKSTNCVVEDGTDLDQEDVEIPESSEPWAAFWPHSPPYNDSLMDDVNPENDSILRHFMEIRDSSIKQATTAKQLERTIYPNPFPDSTTESSLNSPINHGSGHSSVVATNTKSPGEISEISLLRFQLNKAFLPSAYDNSKMMFLPRSAVDDLICSENIRGYWSELTDSKLREQSSDVINYVCGQSKARFVFAIIVLIDEPWLLHGLIQESVCDDDLPLRRVKERGTDFQLARLSSPTKPIRCFMEWTASQRRTFEDLQRQVKPEVLGAWPIRLPVTELSDRAVLPLTRYERIHHGNSKVIRVEIHHAHHPFDDAKDASANRTSSFALKVLKAEDAHAFSLEVKALMKIRPKTHLVTALTAFKYQNKYHLLFKWADGGNLDDLWKSQIPSLTHNLICWFAQQCCGLADGLDGIHNALLSSAELENGPLQDSAQPNTLQPMEDRERVHGRHGDIKPENILWFRNDVNEYNKGVLKITDFGVTAFHTARTTKVLAKYLLFTTTYAAPEIDVSDGEFEAYVSRPFDIWSLGCVYLEFITWVLLGNEGIEEFAKNRLMDQASRKKFRQDNFYTIHRRGRILFWNGETATIKQSVIRWIHNLRQHRNCSEFLREFLYYIQEKMLVIDKAKRDTSTMVRKRLRDMLNQCEHVQGYATQGRF